MKKKRDYKLEAAMLQRVLGVLVHRIGTAVFISHDEITEADARGLEVQQTTAGVSFRIPERSQSRIITLHG